MKIVAGIKELLDIIMDSLILLFCFVVFLGGALLMTLICVLIWELISGID